MTALRTAIAVLLALVGIVAAGCGGGGALGARSLAKQAEAVQSLAAEGALLAEDSAAGRSLRTYRREHSSELASAASTAAASLRGAETEPALAAERRRLAAIATSVAAQLGRLAGASAAEQRAIGRRLERAARVSERIGEDVG